MDYYDTQDFKDYIDFFNENKLSIDKFTDSLNYVIEEKENVCDYHIVMSCVKDVNKESFHKIRFIYNNKLSVYYYLKFLLLDESEKLQILKVFKLFVFDDLSYAMENLYMICEDDTLNNFMDYKDNYRNYQPLNIQKLVNIKDAHCNQYLHSIFIDKFILVVHNYYKAKFLYHLIYFISTQDNFDESNFLKDYESNSLKDFICRFISCKNIFKEMCHYLNFFSMRSFLIDFFSSETNYKTIDLLKEFLHSKFKKEFRLDNHLDYIELNSKILLDRYRSYYFSKLKYSFDYLLYVFSKLKNCQEKIFSELFLYLEKILKNHFLL